MGGGEAVSAGSVIAGIGCRRGCDEEDIVALVDRARRVTGRSVASLAAPAFKSGEAGLHRAAERLGLALILVDRAALAAAQARCTTLSVRAEQATGVASVAEGSALAAAGADGRLLLPRIAGRAATCALAEAAAS